MFHSKRRAAIATATTALLCVIAATAFAGPLTAQPPIPGVTQAPLLPDIALLNTHATTTLGFAGPVSGPFALTAGTKYDVVVAGTFSAWDKWPPKARLDSCGTPTAVLFDSPGVTTPYAGMDAEYRFAAPDFRGCNFALLGHQASLQINVGSGWVHYAPLPRQETPQGRYHRYDYVVTGTGVAPQFRLLDWDTRDNNGVLVIRVKPATFAPGSPNPLDVPEAGLPSWLL
jgi:hypothetical protein